MVRTLVYAGDTLAALVAEARWREQAREEPPTILEWLEQEIQEAREAAFRQFARRENAEYWTGYADALQDVLNAIRRREVRA
ncbi:hypothetical protein [Thermococcus prieurii]